MKSQQFQDILNAVPLLTNQQRNTLINALSEENPSTDIAKTIEESFVRAPKCPHCGSESLQRWGVRNHRQRFRCKTCRRTLNAFSKTPLARLRRPEAWSKYLEGMTHSLTLRPAAKQCGISLQTSFRWRHRFLQVVEHDQAPEFSGIAELDETFFRESFKGQKRNLPRSPRKRGNDKKTECRQIPVMVARDRSKQTVDGVLENGSAQELCRHLNGRINIETVVCADASLAHVYCEVGLVGSQRVPACEGVAKAPEKKGTTKTRRHKVFSEPAQATSGRQKRLPLCLGVFVVQGFYAFCDTLLREGSGWLLLYRFAP